MNFEPQKFFIGLIDFFSILLPGALLTYLLKEDVGTRLLGDRYDQITGIEGWVVFLFSSYLLGHFIFLVGSWLLDDHVYDRIRKATDQEQIKRLAEGKKLSSVVTRSLAAIFIKGGSGEAVGQAVKIKNHYLDPLNSSEAINAFQWCKAKLTLKHPEALAAVQRFEADSKFFRSLVVVLFLLLPWELFNGRPEIVAARSEIAAISVLLLVLAFWRYVDQRVKATNQAYWYIITLESQAEGGFRQPLESPGDGLSHAGGVVFRRTGDRVEYLLVQAKRAPQDWVLPKGHIKAGKPVRETAVREVREETGVWARVRNELGSISFTGDGKTTNVQFFLMEAMAEGKPIEERKHKWLTLDEALHRATHNETKDLMKLAEQRRAAP